MTPRAPDLAVLPVDGGPPSSEEFRYGLMQLRRMLPPGLAWVEAAGRGLPALERAACAAADARGLPDAARVLLLGHGQLLLARGGLERLGQALDADPGLSAALAFDSGFPPPQAPDYCTLRGMERYADALARHPAPPLPDTGQAEPLVVLTTAGALRAGPARARAAWIAGAFAHDFSGYHQSRREEMLPLLPQGVRRLLDVGGGEGGFLQAAKAARGCETHLAEASAQACLAAQGRVDRVWPGDFLAQRFEGLPPRAFDCISFLEVLEHVADPLAWLARARELLAPGGVLLASIPNVGHWGVLADLLEGRWDYCPVGIHCITHLRFFTAHGVHELMAQAGLEVERMETLQVACPPGWAAHWAQTPGLQVQPGSWDAYAFLLRARPV